MTSISAIITKMSPRHFRPDSDKPFEISGKNRWTMSTTNFWILISFVVGGVWAYADLKSDNRVRDLVFETRGREMQVQTEKIIVLENRMIEMREILIKVNAQLESVGQEQHRVSRQLELAEPSRSSSR